MGSAAAAWIGGGTLYGNGNLAATAGLSNNMIKLSILYGFEGKMLFRFMRTTVYDIKATRRILHGRCKLQNKTL